MASPTSVLDAQTRRLLSHQLSANLLEDSAENAQAFYSRLVWSRLVEPGDKAAGALTGQLGPAQALEILLSQNRPPTQQSSATQKPVANQTSPMCNSTISAEVLERWLPRLSLRRISFDLNIAATRGFQIVTPESQLWPGMLTDLQESAPQVLWCSGDVNVLNQKMLAVVGARAATSYGENVTAELVSGIAASGNAIVSGGAFGIDAAAHRAAISSGSQTVAVLAGGVDRLYPSAHAQLFEKIVRSGAVVAEMPPGQAPTKWRFLQRNRLIAAISKATLVCEAGHRSGSLNTAGHAAELGRPLGAVPGPITSASSAGCHRLFRDYAAICIRSVSDLLELLGEAADSESERLLPGESDEHRRVLDALGGRRYVMIDSISRAAGLSQREVAAVLVELELLNLVTGTSAGWRRTPDPELRRGIN